MSTENVLCYINNENETVKKANRNVRKMFRFQDLEIWKKAIEIGDKLLDIADEFEKKKLCKFAEQIRGAGLSMSNNIAEGSGSFSDKEFASFLNRYLKFRGNLGHRLCPL